MRLSSLAALLFPLVGVSYGSDRGPITNLHDLCVACTSRSNVDRHFDIRGHVIHYFPRPGNAGWIVSVADGADSVPLYEENLIDDLPATNYLPFALNDAVRATGVLYEYRGTVFAGYKSIELLARRPIGENDRLKPGEWFRDGSLHRFFRVRGTVREAFRDESDANYVFLMLISNGEMLHAMIHHRARDAFDPADLIGAEIAVDGYCSTASTCLRKHVGRLLHVPGLDNVRILRKPTHDPATIPDIRTLKSAAAADFPFLGHHQAIGTVIARWRGNAFLLRTCRGETVKVRLLESSLPKQGQVIRAIGIPESNLYFIDLVNASWQPADAPSGELPSATDVSAGTLLVDRLGHPQIKIEEHGCLLRLSGVVRHLPQPHDRDWRLHVESDGWLIAIDASECRSVLDGLTLGSRVAVTGVCVMDIDSYGLGTSVPKAKGFFLVPRSADDVAVLSRPSWWTPFRLLCVIGALLLVLVGILIWNTMLRRLAERRGRELADEQVKCVTSELKVCERTHLAVELHDSLSQTLSGVSMQIDAVKRFSGTDPVRMSQHLDIAAKTLKSCRDELRNCLLDLRNNALEENDMNAAIRKTLEPYLDDADIAIRFSVPRDIFSDNTAHTVLRIVRELVVNALRHGKADKIKVAGSVEGRKLMFSVRDNGCGFAPDGAPGIAEGHFGLQGIRERVDELGGVLEIASAPGKGTKVTVEITLPQDSTGEGHAED